MEFLKKYKISGKKALKVGGIILAVIIIAPLLLSLVGRSLDTLSSVSRSRLGVSTGGVPSLGLGGADYGKSMMPEAAYDMAESVTLSLRNVAPSPVPPQEPVPGADAEQYEVKEYSAHYETAELEGICPQIMALKAREDIIFERADENDDSCRYHFKVATATVQEVLDILESLDPKEMSENVFTIKRVITDFTSQQEILERRLETIEATLEDAVDAYDSITQLTIQTRDAETLAKVIESKIRTIERLTQERLNVSTQLDRLAQQKAEQLDRLDYAYFRVTVIERKYIDGEAIADSWKDAVRDFVDNTNQVAQNISVNLAALLLVLLQYLIYLAILLVVVKYGWRSAKAFWKK